LVGCQGQKHNKKAAVLVTKKHCIIALCPKRIMPYALDLEWNGEEGSVARGATALSLRRLPQSVRLAFWLADSTRLSRPLAGAGPIARRRYPAPPPLKWRPGRLTALRAARAGGDEAEITQMIDGGGPYTYVTTKAFPSHFGFDTLRNLRDMEALEDAGLLSKEKLLAGDFLLPADTAPVDDDNLSSDLPALGGAADSVRIAPTAPDRFPFFMGRLASGLVTFLPGLLRSARRVTASAALRLQANLKSSIIRTTPAAQQPRESFEGFKW
jgi:hypothetical protein